MKSLFQGTSVRSSRIIYTSSSFARSNLLYLQEIGELQAIRPHTSSREGLFSFLFFLVTDGEGTLTYNGTNYTLRTGDCVFIDCRKSYSHCSSASSLWSLKWVHFYGNNMNGIYEKYMDRGGRPSFPSRQFSMLSSLLSELQILAAQDDYIRDMKINEKLTSLLTLLMSESWHPENNSRTGLKKNGLQNIRAYLEEHYNEKISLGQLAEQFYINKYYLSRMYKEQFGITVQNDLSRIRISHAKQLLRFSDLTVEEIGRCVGIDEPGYFSRVFKKIEGLAPFEYRKMW